MTREEWLAQIRVHDEVAVYFGSQRMSVESVTSAPKTFVTTGRHARRVNFSRSDGYMTGDKAMSRWFHIEQP